MAKLFKLIDLGRVTRVTRSGFIGILVEPSNAVMRYNP